MVETEGRAEVGMVEKGSLADDGGEGGQLLRVDAEGEDEAALVGADSLALLRSCSH